MRKLVLFASLSVLALLTIVPIQAQGLASVRVAHFSPDAPAVDVYIDGEIAVEALEYPGVSGFLAVDAGTYSVAVAATGTSLDDAVIGPIDLTLEGDTYTTVAAVGSLADETLTATVFTEDIGAIGADEASLTFVNAMEGAPGVDVYGSNILLMQSVRYPSANSDGAFTRTVPPGGYDFDVNIAENRAAILLEVDDIRLEAGTAYMLVALGSEDDAVATIVTPDSVILTPLPEEETEETTEVEEPEVAPTTATTTDTEVLEGSASLRVAHFSPDAPAVDVYVNGEVAVEGLEYPAVTAFMGMDAGTYSVAVAAAGTSLDDAVIGPVDVTLEADTYTTVAAVGSLADETLTATVFTEDIGDIAADQASLTFVNAMEGAPGVDVYGSNILLMQSVRYPSANSDGAFTRTVPPGGYDFDVNIAENRAAILLEVDDIRLEAGTAYMLVALGSEDDAVATIVTPDEVILTPLPEEEE